MNLTTFLIASSVVGAAVLWIAIKHGGMFAELGGTDSEVVRNAKVLRRGIPGQGVVESISETGEKGGGLMLIKLLVHTENWQPYEVTLRTPIKAEHLPRVQPGCKVSVKIDSRNAESVALVL